MKYFVVSDIHGHYKELRKALDTAGFDIDNRNHTLITLGDNFDRGGLSRGVFNYIYSLPRKICIKGNHELMLEDIFDKGYLDYTDMMNGCDRTIASFSYTTPTETRTNQECVYRASKYSNLKTWLKSLPYYYETDNYIFVHGWVTENDWVNNTWDKEETNLRWWAAVWANTEYYIRAVKEKNKYKELLKNKTLVFGHTGTHKLHHIFPMKNKVYTDGFCYDIWKDDKLIGIDTNTINSKKINVLILED